MPWTYEHFLTLPITVAIFIFFATWLGDKLQNAPEKYRLIPIHIISAILIILEIIKQVYSICIGYNLHHIPLHFCSLFVFLFPAFSVCKGKLKRTVRLINTLAGLMMIAIMAIMPNIVYNNTDINTFFTDFLSFHTVFFHNLVILGILLIFTLDLYEKPRHGDYKVVISSFVIYSIIAATLALLLNTNFNNFCRCGVEFIDIFVRQSLINVLGYFGQILYSICVGFTTTSFGVLLYFIYVKILAWYEKYKWHKDKYISIG